MKSNIHNNNKKVKISESILQSHSTIVSNNSITKQSTTSITKTTSIIFGTKPSFTNKELTNNQTLAICKTLRSSDELTQNQYEFLEKNDHNLLTELMNSPNPYREEEIDEENNRFSYGNTPDSTPNNSNDNSMIDSFGSNDSNSIYTYWNKQKYYDNDEDEDDEDEDDEDEDDYDHQYDEPELEFEFEDE